MKVESLTSTTATPATFGVAVRPTLLFVAAFALNITPHEVVHALVAYLLGFSSTLFQMWANPDAASRRQRNWLLSLRLVQFSASP
jgi:membrane-associated protease RseP (regulator of RpoE activity)